MKHATPEPPEIGTREGLSYALFQPDGEASGAIVVCHGAGSAKESHFDFCRAVRASGMCAIAYDMRGHGRSDGALGPGLVEDALSICELAQQRAPAVGLRGSSLGGFAAISAAARSPERIAAVAAICPAPADFLARGLRAETLTGFEVDREALAPWLEEQSLVEDVRRLAGEVALLLLHAEGDESVPYAVSEELFAAADDPKRLLLLPGGHHRSLQHDLEIHALSIRFIAEAIRP